MARFALAGRLGAALSAALTASGCSAPAPDAVGLEAQPVLYGAVSTSDEDMVVEVISKTDTVSHTCTGTLLAPNVVITARHCVATYVDAHFTCTSDGELTPDSQGGKMGPVLDPSQITVRKGVKPPAVTTATAVKVFATQATTICRNDIAVIVLDKMLDLPTSPVRLRAGIVNGETIRVVGYGVDENNMFGTRHTRSGLAISQVGSSQFRPVGDNVPPRTFVTEGPALCIGDSGGPAFSMESAAIIGVWSQVVGECGASTARNFFTEIAPFEDELITPAFAEAGGAPWLEGTTGPGEPTGGNPGAGGDGGAPSTEGGAPASGGSGDTGGAVTSGGKSSGGTSTSAGLDAGGSAGAAGGLRKKGGCTCTMPGSRAPADGAWLGAPLFALGLLLRRARSRRSV